jgi:hypothetical protein
MSGNESNRRIKYALYFDGWDFENGSQSQIKRDAIKVAPSEYQSTMDGALFCPVCFTNLNRIPKNKEYFSNGREAYFAHLSTYKNIKCDLRSDRPEGKKYDTYEEAQRAIDDENLVIVSGFMKEKPELPEEAGGEYDETPVEDVNGPASNTPISRHSGESYRLPSKITTVAGICRKFDENLYKYYYFPNQRHAVRLIDLLRSVESVEVENIIPKLYYGRIDSTTHLGEHKTPNNIRMTYLKNNQEDVQDFCIKLKDRDQKNHGITDASVGRTVIVFGKVVKNGTGLCFTGLGWGEFSLLPTKYDILLE